MDGWPVVYTVDGMDLYRFPVFLSKSYESTERGAKQYILEGVASDETSDQQQEIIDQSAMDFQPLMRSGFINWDHQGGPENQIGEPLLGEITPANAFFVRGMLYVDDVERAAHAWRLAKAAERAQGTRRLGWSVEGSVLQRSGRRIVKSEVRQLALTHQPVNANTWAAIAKSMTIANAAPIQLEQLDDRLTSMLWGDCTDGRSCYSDTGRFHSGRAGAVAHLCLCKGMPVERASALMKRLIDSGI